MNQAEFAAHLGKTRAHVAHLKNDGRLVMNGDQVDVEATMKLIEDTSDPSKAGVVARHEQEREQKQNNPMDSQQGLAGSAYQQARAMREKYAAMQAKLAYEKEVGLLLEANGVRLAVADGDAIIRNRLEALPDILAPQLASEKDEQKIRRLLTDHIETILAGLSKTFGGMAKS